MLSNIKVAPNRPVMFSKLGRILPVASCAVLVCVGLWVCFNFYALQCYVARWQYVFAMLDGAKVPDSGVKIPFQYYDNEIFIEQKQKNGTVLFLQVDTGASGSQFDQSAPISMKPAGVDSDVSPGSDAHLYTAPVYYVTSLQFAEINIPTLVARKGDNRMISSLVGREVHGVIGQDLLGYFSVELNYPEKLLVLKPLTSTHQKGPPWSHKCPTVLMTIAGHEAVGVIDSGSDIVAIPDSMSGWMNEFEMRTYVLGDSKERKGRVSTTDDISVANQSLKGIPVGAGKYDMPLVGNSWLKFFDVIMISRTDTVETKLRDWKYGDELRVLLAKRQWQKAIDLIAGDDSVSSDDSEHSEDSERAAHYKGSKDWRINLTLMNCYDQLKQSEKAAEIAHSLGKRFPSEEWYWRIEEAKFLHRANKDASAEALLHPLFSSETSDSFGVLAGVRSLADDPVEGLAVCDRLLQRYPNSSALKNISKFLEHQINGIKH